MEFGLDPKGVSDIFKYSSGSILFVNASGIISQDNSNLFFDAVSKALTVGGNLEFKAGTANKGIFTHANSADHTYTFPDYNGTLATLAGAETLTNKTMSGANNTFLAIGYASLVLTNSIVNADIAAGAAIAYSKLNLTGSIVDADIAATGITTRSKLPSSIAYEDETNTFTQAQTFNADVTAGTIYVGSSSSFVGGANAGAARIGRASDRGTGTLTLQLGNNTLNAGFEVVDGSWDRVLFSVDQNTDRIYMGAPVNFSSFTATNFVAANPVFSGAISASGDLDFTSASSKVIYATTLLWEETPGVLAIRDSTNTVYNDLKIRALTTSGNITIDTNKLLTAGAELYSFNSDTALLLRRTTANGAQRLYIMPNGTNDEAEIALFSNDDVTLSAFRVLSISTDGTAMMINSTHIGLSLIPIKLQMGGNDIITLNTDNTVNLNNRELSNTVFGAYTDYKVVSTPADPSTDYARVYARATDANNNGLFVRIKKLGVISEVQIA